MHDYLSLSERDPYNHVFYSTHGDGRVTIASSTEKISGHLTVNGIDALATLIARLETAAHAIRQDHGGRVIEL